jgi:hypothetical protein
VTEAPPPDAAVSASLIRTDCTGTGSRRRATKDGHRPTKRAHHALGAVLGLAAEDALVQGCLRGIFDLEMRLTAPRAEMGSKLAIRKRFSETLKVLTLPVRRCHEAGA